MRRVHRLAHCGVAAIVLIAGSLTWAQGSRRAEVVQDPAAVAMLERMIAAERDFDVIGTVEERVLLPGVRSDDEARGGFVLPVGITAALVLRAFTLEVLPAEALRAEAVTDRPLEVLRLEGRGP